MSDLNVRIAKVLGWTEEDAVNGYRMEGDLCEEVPQYNIDLNLMRNLIEDLDPEEYRQYLCHLGVGTPADITIDDFTLNYVALAHIENATAAQKAEAFLKVKEQIP